MLTRDRLDALVAERLGGDRTRLGELFDTREVFDALRAGAVPADWYHFRPMTFDGDYLVETPGGFEVWQQERGVRGPVLRFQALREAALHVFG